MDLWGVCHGINVSGDEVKKQDRVVPDCPFTRGTVKLFIEGKE